MNELMNLKEKELLKTNGCFWAEVGIFLTVVEGVQFIYDIYNGWNSYMRS